MTGYEIMIEVEDEKTQVLRYKDINITNAIVEALNKAGAKAEAFYRMG